MARHATGCPVGKRGHPSEPGSDAARAIAPDTPFARSAPAAPLAPHRRVDGEPTFAEPWEAQAFALAVHLHERGLFAREEWSAALAEALDDQDDAAGGADYYRCWLVALERLLLARGVAAPGEIDTLATAWQRAARATPHGEPITLGNDQRGRAGASRRR